MEEIKQIINRSTYANINRMIDISVNETFDKKEYSAEFSPEVIKATIDSANCTNVIDVNDYIGYCKILKNIKKCRNLKEQSIDINCKKDFIENLKFWR